MISAGRAACKGEVTLIAGRSASPREILANI